MANEYRQQLLKLRASIIFTIDKMPPERRNDQGEYLKSVLENVMLMINTAAAL